MSLNDVMRQPVGVTPIAVAITAASGENAIDISAIVPARSVTVATRGGSAFKVTMTPGGIAAGKYKSLPSGAQLSMEAIRQKTIYVSVTADDTVEVFQV